MGNLRDDSVRDSGGDAAPKDIKTTILIVELLLKGLKMWRDWREKRKAAKYVEKAD
jgi:hypothetical protein